MWPPFSSLIVAISIAISWVPLACIAEPDEGEGTGTDDAWVSTPVTRACP